MDQDWKYSRGEVYIATLDPTVGSEQSGTRPVLILQNNSGNFFGQTLIVAPITSKFWKKPHQGTHCLLTDLPFLSGPSTVQLEQIRTIDKSRVRRYLGRLPRAKMDEVDDAIRCSLGIKISETVEFP